jgi:hypothetical protein
MRKQMIIPIVEAFPKTIFTRADVERERLLRLSIRGVIGSEISDGGDRWVLTTTYPAEDADLPPSPPPADNNAAAKPAVAGESVKFGSLVPKGFFSNNPDDHSVPRSIRTNNPGALNISSWQKSRPGFAGVTEADHSGNQTTIYRTPEHGVAAWFHLLSIIYGFSKKPSFRIGELAQCYSGRDSGPVVDTYVAGWSGLSHGTIDAQTEISLADDTQTLNLARAIFFHEAGKDSPLHDDQISFAVAHERDGTLPT